MNIKELFAIPAKPDDDAAVRWMACPFQGLVNLQVNLVR